MLKTNIINAQTHHFPIILLYFTIKHVLDLICACGVCMVETLYNDIRTLLVSSQLCLQ